MLISLNEAKKYAVEKVEKFTGEEVIPDERDLIEMGLENNFFDNISDIVSDEEIEKAKLTSSGEVEGYLFHKITNYTNILEETTSEFLSDYLSE